MMEIDPKIRAIIVKLRKARTTLLDISDITDINSVYVTNILKEELGDQYYNYSLIKPKMIFSEQQKERVVTLRKDGNILEVIKDITKIPVHHISAILKNELGEECSNYRLGSRCQKYREGWREKEASEILRLRGKGKSLKEIKKLTNISSVFIKRVLIQKGAEDLKPDAFAYGRPPAKNQVVSMFNEWYYKVARAVKAGSPKVLGPMKAEAIEIFLNLLKGLPQPSHKRNELITVFVYSFFRTKGINVPFSLLRKLSGLTKHEYFHMLKKINGIFPEYMTRDRKNIILGKVHEIENSFQLNSGFFKNASIIAQKFWGILSNTTDTVVAGTVSALALISIQSTSPTLSKVCQELKIQQSTMIYQIKKLVKRLNVSGFTTVGKSKELLFREVLKEVIG